MVAAFKKYETKTITTVTLTFNQYRTVVVQQKTPV
jgi:hypothetical protein